MTYTPTETQWVDAELVRNLIRIARNTQLATWLIIPVYVGVLWGEAHGAALAAWTVAAVAVAMARMLVMRHYSLRIPGDDPVAQLAYFNRWRHVWSVSAFSWASVALLFFDSTSLATQFMCWLMMAGIAMFAVNSLSGHLRCARAYVDTLMATTVFILAWRVGVDVPMGSPYIHYWLIGLMLIFWQVLRQAARRLHQGSRRNFELQYRNSQLIESLTRQTQAALDAVEIKNRFLASATHDIRQPVHALGLYADWLASEPELVHEIAPKILESTKAVNALFDSLFDLVRLDSGKIRLNLTEVRLDQLLREMEVQYRPLAEAKGLEFRVRTAGGVVQSDAILLRRIVGNLVSNAIKYTPEGSVLLAVRHAWGAPRIEVWDTGVGIAQSHQRDVFREFYKVPVHAGTEDGFGLGLYIVARLSHILGHPVDLASRPGRGTVFRLEMKPSDPDQAFARAASMDQLARRP
ncbi:MULTISPECIES: sensor histidine kinase [unclassified Ramlibacter]|uniref:sensor histidine kinase n=1 Tax=unclassified Ramlibacter TaxID=2617605 RepID=UPI00366F9B14